VRTWFGADPPPGANRQISEPTTHGDLFQLAKVVWHHCLFRSGRGCGAVRHRAGPSEGWYL